MIPFITYPIYPRRKTWIVTALFAVIALGTVAVFAFDSSASAQSPSNGLVIQSLTVNETGESARAITYEARVTIANSSESDFSGLQRVDYQIDDGDKQLAYIVTSLQSGQTATFTFNFGLTPGEHTIRVEVGDSARVPTITVAGADIDVEIVDYRFIPGRSVEFDLQITNSGDLIAEELALTSMWRSTDGDVSGEQIYTEDIPDLEPSQHTTATVPIQISPGSYDFQFTAVTRTIEGDSGNNSAQLTLDVEFADLRTNVVATEILGWNGDGKALMSITVEVTNEGVDNTSTFYIGIACDGESEDRCSTSSQSDEVLVGESVQTEMRLWLPIGDTPTRIFAVENEDTFRWGNLNAIDHTFVVPNAPETVWTLSKIPKPEIARYWSDGSANVDLNLTFINNGTNESQTVVITCSQNDVIVDDCGAEFSVEMESDVHPTLISQTLKLPRGDTNLAISYGAAEPGTTSINVPKRIIGVERDVWSCFSDTSNIVDDSAQDDEEEENDEGIGCAGWDREYVTKWPNDEAIKLWSFGDAHYLKILDEVVEDVASFLNMEIERAATKSEAQLKVHTGVPRENADSTGLDCVEFAGCARTWVDHDGRITASTISIWSNRFQDEKQRDAAIRSTTLHELLHALTNIKHRHHDRTSVMSYDALNYSTIDGMDRGLFALHAHPLVQPGMSFEEVLDLIVFTDELVDPPEPVELSAPALLRRAHATLMNAESFSFEVKGGWPGCSGNDGFGWAQLESANLIAHAATWRHFHDGTDRYYYIGNPDDWGASEWWLRRGRNWSNVGVQRVTDATTFRGGFSSLLQTLSDINTYASDTDYTVTSRANNRVEIEVNIDQPNPRWSRGLNLEINIAVHPENFQILDYEMTWKFDPRNQRSCDTYTIEARSPQYNIDFTFPDAIRADSQILAPATVPDEPKIEVEVTIVN